MGFYINCPHCFGNQHLPNSESGKTIKCAYCNKEIKLCNDIPEIEIVSLSQLRMQALNTACDFELFSEEEGNATLSNAMIIADQIVHYCLTGEHQLPEKKDD